MCEMPRLPRRGRIVRRYAENVIKQSLSGREPNQHPRNNDTYQTQPPERRVPHYEDDPNWNSSHDSEEVNRGMQRNPSFNSYNETHNEQRILRNARGTWAPGRMKKSGMRGRGRVKKLEPPLALCGIPHLDRSFVMAQSSVGAQNTGESSTSDNRTTEYANDTIISQQQTMPNENKANTLTPPANTSDLSFDQQITEETDYHEIRDTANQIDSQINHQHSAEPSSSIYPNENKDDSARKCDESSNPSSEQLKLADPAELEKETKKYYEELLGVKSTEDSAKTTVPEENSFSAKQVADITKKYDTADIEKAKEEAREEEIQTAWSILHQYWEFVRENPYDFNGWTYLLTHVENMDNLEAARSAFEGFLPLYPYCFAYWKRLSDMELKHKATERSLGVLWIGTQCIPFCVDLWMPFLNNFISYAKQKDLPPQCVRQLYEYGLKSIGMTWHSSSFWEGCISYELHNGNLVGVMQLYKRLLTTPTKLYNKHWDHFLALVRDHHPRNLLSLDDYEALRKKTCEELKIKYTPTRHITSKSLKKTPQPEDKLSTCMKEKLVASYIKTHESNEEQVDKRWKYEERIKRPYFHIKSLDKKQIKNWKEYLEFELKEGDPIRIVVLFERCLVSCALYEEFWCQYCSYMEKHVQDINDGKYKDYVDEEISDGSDKSLVDSENAAKSVSEMEVTESSTNANISSGSVSGDQVNNKNNVDVKDVTSEEDSIVRGSEKEQQIDGVINSSEGNNSAAEISDNQTLGEQDQNINSESAETCKRDLDEKNEQNTTNSEPPTLEQIRTQLCANLSVDERVLKSPLLTPKWIMTGVSWEDVRQIYRRGAWIHCPSKPSLLMQWAEFEEMQGNLETARELLNTVIAKYPTLLKGRMQLIELERRAGCYDRVEELYGDASRAFTLPRQRSWLAIKFARFLFKVLMEADRALSVLRKALKKDRGYVHLYHHVFDICYQRQPLDCQGVLASVLLAITSKELLVEDKYWFAYKRVQFLREHGSIHELKGAMKELEELKEQAGLNVVKESKSNPKKEKETPKNDEEDKKQEDENKIDTVKKEEETSTSCAVDVTNPVPESSVSVPNPASQQFPVPFFSSDGAITYSPMEGYGYGHTDPSQNLPTAQEVVQGGPPPNVESKKEEFHSVPPSWELDIQIGSYGYGTSQDHQWHQESGHRDYDSLISKGYPSHLKDHEVEEMTVPIPIKIDHLRRKPNNQDHPVLPDLTQPPPNHAGPPPNMEPLSNKGFIPQGSQASNRVLLPTPPCGQGSNKVLLPTPPGLPVNFTRPPPPVLGVGPPGLLPPGLGPPGSFQDTRPPGEEYHRPFFDDSHPFGKRHHPDDYWSKDEPPFKMQNTRFDNLQRYRSEYDNNYTSSPGPSAPPSHRANFGTDDEYDMGSHGRRESDHPTDHFSEDRENYSIENSRLNDPNRYSLREEGYDVSLPREMSRSETESLCVNVPDWLVQEGGELRLSDTSSGSSLIRYWPSFMTTQGHSALFRALRKRMKWYQRRALIDGQWQNLPHLLSWIGPCDYSYSGMTLDKNTDWLPEIVDLLHRLIRYTGNQYNCCYMALHRNGYDHTTWMSEDHLALRKNPSIASVSLGATRLFEMRRKNGGGYLRFPLFPGSLLLMEGATQEDWTYQFPKQPNVAGERIHLIFRKFYMIEGLTV